MTTPNGVSRAPRRTSSVSAAPSSRGSPSQSSTTPASTLVAKGVASRSTITAKVAPPIRRPGTAQRPASVALTSPDGSKTRDSSSKDVSLDASSDSVVNIEAFEELRLRVQELDSSLSTLSTENASLKTSLTQAETRIAEMFADQGRMDEELGVRLDLSEKLRAQLREVEKEKRDLNRRYTEQTAAFEAERQSFYDNEQHLKSRIQSLSQTRKTSRSDSQDKPQVVSEVEYPPPPTPGPMDALRTPRFPRTRSGTDTPNSRDEDNDDNEPAEMTSLKLELSTLATSHHSLQSTFQLLQSQLIDLQRVNAELQEENEGWKVLIQQRTLAGTFDVLALGGHSRDADGEMEADDDNASMNSGARSQLDKVSEMEELAYEAEIERERSEQGETELDPAHTFDEQKDGNYANRSELDPSLFNSPRREGSPVSRNSDRSRRRGRNAGQGEDDERKGESLANLPITGPGLDLAAELGRAQNSKGFVLGNPPKFKKKERLGENNDGSDQSKIQELRQEVKHLKEANKALSLYASKIIDRIIATDGFENVLAVDYQERTPVSKRQNNQGTLSKLLASAPSISSVRPASLLFNRSGSGSGTTAPPKEKLTTFESIGLSNSSSAQSPPVQSPPIADSATSRHQRRSMSFDFRGFSLFGQNPANPPTGSPAAPLGKKLETTEDEEDRKERERVRATMRLMGIDPPDQTPGQELTISPDPAYQEPLRSPLVPLSLGGKVVSIGAPPDPTSPRTATGSRWSFFGRKETPPNGLDPNPTALTAESLQRAEAEQHLATLDAREKIVKEEIAKGGGGGFTEIARRTSSGRSLGEEWRSRRSSPSISTGTSDIIPSGGLEPKAAGIRRPGSEAGSAHTVWSAGGKDE